MVIATPSMLGPHDPLAYPNIKRIAVAGEACPQGELLDIEELRSILQRYHAKDWQTNGLELYSSTTAVDLRR